MTVKLIYMFVTYILWGSIFYTSINIPYGSMASAISEEPKIVWHFLSIVH